MKFSDVLADVRAEVLVEFAGPAALVDYNPTARWIGRLCVRELNIRKGEAVPDTQDVAPLELADDEVEFALEWLDETASHFANTGADHRDADLLRLAALVDHVRETLLQRIASPLQ